MTLRRDGAEDASGGDVTLESRGWADTPDRYAVHVVGGSKSIEVVERPE